MKISVITPTFNSEKYIRQNVQSVVSQTYTDYEHIIVDNKSTDATLQFICDEYESKGLTEKLVIVSEKDNGISEAFNKGITLASGEIIAFLNSDDYYFSEDVFQEIIDAFANEEILFVHGNIYFEDEKYGSNIRKPLMCKVQQAMPFNHPAMFVRKKCLEEAGLFDTSFRYAMDFELTCRMLQRIPNFLEKGFYLNDVPLVYMRGGGASWLKEKESVIEVKNALQKNGLWNSFAKYFYVLRRGRILLKSFLDKVGLLLLVKYWRKFKWN
ncbi:MAG: glycosyltransferase family 2 protein [Ignavibacteria bacterium]|nr:glycosyltransferase family 2 protein [Ignavibacteria bacterium]